GNDFAIDDISLLELCTYEDKINVKITPAKTTDVSAEICQGQSYTLANQTFLNEGTYVIPLKTWKGCDSIVTLDLKVIEVLSEIEPPSTLGCGNTSLYLTGYNSSFGSGYSYLWKTKDGKIISDPTLWEINISKAGAYELIVSYNDGLISCSKSDMVTVTADTTKPVINAGPDGQLSCTDSLLSLHGTINSPVKYALNWTSTNGTFVSKTDTLSPVIKSPGTYIMHVTDSSNFCMTIDTVIVSVDASLPKSIITGSSLLTCIDSIISLNALLSDQGSDFTFKWTTTGGNIISNIDSLVIQVNSSGQYYLEIDNIKSGCKSTSSININGDFLKAMVDAGLTDTLSCQLTSLFLTGQTNLADSLVTYLWSTYNGKIVSGNTTLTPLINKVGTYVLRVLNKQNGCIQIDSVLIVNDKNLPVSIAGKSDTITCLKSIIDLIGNGSSSGPNITYLWTSINGNFTSPTDQIIAKSDKDGMYVLTVFNQLNGCSSTDTVVIGKNTSFPIANAGATDTLTCVKQNLILNGNGSSAGPKFSYSWTTLNGNIVSGQNTLIPNINLYGNYILLVSNNENGCTNSDTVQIIENKVLPDISVIPTEILTCANPIINLSGVNNSGPGQFKYLWTTINGVIVSGQNNLAPTINAAGTYTLISTNLLNGCTDQDIVMVNSMGEIPQVNAGVDSSLNCSHPNISLSANLVYTGGNLNINWTTINGTIQSGANSLNPLVSKAGIYTITVIDTITGCTNFDQISIGIDTVAPLANLLLPEKLNCIKLITDIEANINNPLWTYTWTTINGNITSGNNNYIAQTDKP
ncbi:MAG TPA: hypothetical protein VK590_13615, partial [Saprospiraceae bacterium]|nr:hypothetical protein [Saprospiraceae bacterium]